MIPGIISIRVSFYLAQCGGLFFSKSNDLVIAITLREVLVSLQLMKKLITVILLSVFTTVCYADIHVPPASEQGPTRKLGRGISNLLFGITELPHCIAVTNDQLGNSAAGGYGVTRGVARTVRRWRYGVQEIILFPFPIHKGKYTAPYRDSAIYLEGGYTEFPPELGWESKFIYRH